MGQTVAEIEEMLNEWEQLHPRTTPTGRVSRKAPAWHKRLNAVEDGTDVTVVPPAGVLTTCRCPIRHWVPEAHLDRRCFLCMGWRRRVE